MQRNLVLTVLILAAASGTAFYGATRHQATEEDPSGLVRDPGRSVNSAPPQTNPSPLQLTAQIRSLEKALRAHIGPDPYIVIDTAHNRLQVCRGDTVLHEAVCATGSGRIFFGPKRKIWHFNTPKGISAVRRKVENPIWVKPEWAFVEQDQPIPILPQDFARFDLTTLGRYSLELGDGYEIHGTLYPQFLGRHITHGCIRLNDDDLEVVHSLSRPGSEVFIY